MDKQSLLQLLANNQMDELMFALKNQQGIYNDLVLLESQWNNLRAQERNGVLTTEQANTEMSRLRKNLLELIEIASGNPSATPPPPLSAKRHSNPTVIFAAAGVAAVLVILFLTYLLLKPSNDSANPETALKTSDNRRAPSGHESPQPTAAPRQLDVSLAQPITFAPGDFQYERVYSVVKTSVESTGGGKSLITLTVGLNFKGIINALLETENFRLVADELPGPLAPANYLNTLVDSKSYAEGDIKFELSDDIHRFTVIVEGKADKKWVFSR